MGNFPDRLSIKALSVTNKEYNYDCLMKCLDLYAGGERFRKRKDLYLLKRPYELLSGCGGAVSVPPNSPPANIPVMAGGRYPGGGGGGKQFAMRLDHAYYTPHMSGLIDWLVAACFQSEPQIISDDPYWVALNTDSDGRGTNLVALMRELLLESLLQRRAYLSIIFPDQPAISELAGFETSKLYQRQTGRLDAKLQVLKAIDIDDWDDDFLRIHRCIDVRPSPWSQPTINRRVWIYLTPEATYQYEYDEIKGEKVDERVEKFAKLVLTSPHSLGQIPAIGMNIPEGMWIAERISDICLALFNREASITWLKDILSDQIKVLKSVRPFENIIHPDTAMMSLDPTNGEDFYYRGPDSAVSDALDKDIDRLQNNLYLAVQAAALVAATKDEHGRQSGVAKFRDFGALATLLSAFAGSLRECLESVVQLIHQARGDEGEPPVITGLNRFDIQDRQVQIDLAHSVLEIPGLSDTVRKWVLGSIGRMMVEDAPPAVQAKVNEDKAVEAVKTELPTIVPPAATTEEMRI